MRKEDVRTVAMMKRSDKIKILEVLIQRLAGYQLSGDKRMVQYTIDNLGVVSNAIKMDVLE